MPLLETTDTLIQEVRSMNNELNQDSLDSDRDILPALNRAQDHMMSILATHYPEPFLQEYAFTVTGGTAAYIIPEDSWSDQVTKVEMTVPGRSNRFEVIRAKYRDATRIRTDANVNIPSYYIIRGREIEFIPKPSGSYNAVMWYVKAPEKLVKQQGRITRVSTVNNRVTVDIIGSGLGTDADSLSSWINIIDGQTGEVKATCQIKTTDSTTGNIVFKSTISTNILAADGTILNRTPVTDISTVTDNNGNLDISPNDYICSIEGTCVPYFIKPARNFIVSHAAADCGRSVGTPSESMYRERDLFLKEIRGTFTGREASLRIKNASPYWNRTRSYGRFGRK